LGIPLFLGVEIEEIIGIFLNITDIYNEVRTIYYLSLLYGLTVQLKVQAIYRPGVLFF